MLGHPTRESLISEAKSFGIYNPENKLCLVIGTSPSMAKDINTFKARFPGIPFDIIAVNKSLIHVQYVKHWCSKHPMCFHGAKWKATRLDKGWQNNFKLHAPLFPSDKKLRNKKYDYWKKHIDYIWKNYIGRGSSTLFGVGISIGLGYKGCVLCGVELTKSYRRYEKHFRNFNRAFGNYAKAQSGCLSHRNILGEPTGKWIERIMKGGD